MTPIEKLTKEIEQSLADESMTPEQKQEILLTILHNSTKLYMQMIKLNLQLKGLPTQNPSVITSTREDVVM